MNILVIGASGRTGRLVVEQGIKRGLRMTAFTRRPQALQTVPGLSSIVQGDALRPDDVRSALHGQDAVIAAFGGSDLARALIQAMDETDVRRLVMTSSRSVVATRPWLPVTLAWLFFHAAYADLARAEGYLEMSDLDWTVVRATRLVDGPGTGRVHIDFEANATGGEPTLSRDDYAMTLLDAVKDPAMSRTFPGVCGAKASAAARAVAV